MNISFQIKNPNQIANIFCRYIIRWIRVDLVRETNFNSVQLRLDLLQYASWVNFNNGKFQRISAKRFIQLVCDSLIYQKRKNTYTITINKNKLFPGTTTPLYKIVKFVDIGNDIVRGSYFLKRLEIKYTDNIYDYWASFKIRLQR